MTTNREARKRKVTEKTLLVGPKNSQRLLLSQRPAKLLSCFRSCITIRPRPPLMTPFLVQPLMGAAYCVLTLGTGRTTDLQGIVHLVIFAAFLFFAAVP